MTTDKAVENIENIPENDKSDEESVIKIDIGVQTSDDVNNLLRRAKFPIDKQTDNAWKTYEPSFQTLNFLSEENRKSIPEHFRTEKFTGIKDLKDLVLDLIIENHDLFIKWQDQFHFEDTKTIGDQLSTSLSIQVAIKVENEVYWKRVVESKCKYKYIYENACKTQDFYWKQLGIELMFTEIIESIYPERWNLDELQELIILICPYVNTLTIEQLLPLREYSIEKNRYNPFYKIYNYSIQDCHHGDLSILADLLNLKSLSLSFGIKNIGRNYEQRYFEFSYQDIENLSNGLKKMNVLEEFSIRSTNMDDRKLKILCRGIVQCKNLEALDLAYCNLQENAGKSIGYLLLNTLKLKRLELKGNRICGEGLQAIGYGLQNFNGYLHYLGLAFNNIGEDGIMAIGGAMLYSEQIKEIDLTGCEVNEIGAIRIIQFIGFHEKLVSMKCRMIPLGVDGGKKLLKILEKNTRLTELDCTGCGLTIEQETEILLLLKRNKYFVENPCLNKTSFTEEEEEIAREWVNRMKHPFMLKLQNVNLPPEPTKRRKLFPHTFPYFISEEHKNIIHLNYRDIFSSDSDIRLFHTERVSTASTMEMNTFDYNPNEFTEDGVIKNARIGTFNLSSNYYFK